MDKIKRAIFFSIPTSICNFRCHYCYLNQREKSYQGKQTTFLYNSEHVAKALSRERLGGVCYFNFCAEGETLLTKNIEKYIYAIVKQGHYVEIITNMTVTSIINKILSWDKTYLQRISFKCSFHYLELKKHNLLNIFSENVNNAWKRGCSASIEITPDDELIPYIDEVKKFSIEHFGALPHLSIARDDSNNHDYLTKLPINEYDKIWSQFNSSFWEFKKNIFNIRRKEFCYAGAWSLYVDLSTGSTKQCYCNRYSQNIFENINKPIEFIAIGRCMESHCYNGHAFLTFGCIPQFTPIGYGDIRDRIKKDGSHWIQLQMKSFLNTKLEENNKLINNKEIIINEIKMIFNQFTKRSKKIIKKLGG